MKYLICKNKNVIFGFNTKCGTQHIHYLYNFLHDDFDKAVFYHKSVDNISDKYSNYKLIIIVRNPYERIVSGFKEKYSNPLYKTYKPYSIPGIKYDKLTFRQFVNELYNNKFKNIDKYHFNLQTNSKYNFINHEDIIIYDIKNIDYEYISKIFDKKITDNIKYCRGDHINKNTKIMNKPVYDLENILYRNLKINSKFYFDTDIKNKVYEIYHNDFEFCNKNNIKTEI